MKIGATHLNPDSPPDNPARSQSTRAIVRGRQDEFLNLDPRAHILLKGAFHADRFLGARRAHGPRIDAPRKVVQVMGRGDSEEFRQAGDGCVGEVADCVDAFAIEDRCGSTAHTPQGPHRKPVEEVDRGLVRDEEKPIGFGVRRSDFRDRFRGCDANRCGQADALADSRADEGRDRQG